MTGIIFLLAAIPVIFMIRKESKIKAKENNETTNRFNSRVLDLMNLTTDEKEVIFWKI